MWSNNQWEKYVKDLGLDVEVYYPEKGATTFTVEGGVLEFKPFSCTLKVNGVTNQNAPTQTFKDLCVELSNKKKAYLEGLKKLGDTTNK